LENRHGYFDILKRDHLLTSGVEEDLELVSGVVSGESFKSLWDSGNYHCCRCSLLVYSSTDKWDGPCIWPSFRRGSNLEEVAIDSYNNYTCQVREVYCSGCRLFFGHAFEDGLEKGDEHPEAQWRY